MLPFNKFAIIGEKLPWEKKSEKQKKKKYVFAIGLELKINEYKARIYPTTPNHRFRNNG